MNSVLSVLSKEAGHNGTVEASYFANDNDAAMRQHAEAKKAQNTDKNRKPYDTRSNNCATFVCDTLKAGGVDTKKDYLPKEYSRNAQQVATRVYRYSPEPPKPKDSK